MAIIPEVIQSPIAGTGVGELPLPGMDESVDAPVTKPQTSDAKFAPNRPDNVITIEQQKELVKAYQEKGLYPKLGLQMLVQDGKQLEGYDSSVRAYNTAVEEENTDLPDANLLSRGTTAVLLPVVNAIRKRMGKDKLGFDESAREFQKTAFQELGGVPSIGAGAAQSITSVPTDIVGAVVGVVDKDKGKMIQDKGDITDRLQRGGIVTDGWFDAAKFATDTGMTLAAGTRILSGIKSIPALEKFSKTYKQRHKYLTAGTEGLIDTHIASVLGEGEFAGKLESVGGTAIGVAIPGAGALIGKLPGIGKSFATKLQLQGLMTPKKLQQIQNQLKELGVVLKGKKQLVAEDIVGQVAELGDKETTQVVTKLRELGVALPEGKALSVDDLTNQLDQLSSTKLREIRKEMKKLGVKITLKDTIADDVSQFMFDRNITGSPREMVEKLEDLSFVNKQNLKEKLGGLASTTFKGTEAIDDAIFEYSRLVKGAGGGRLLKDIPKKLDALKLKSTQGTLTLEDVQDLKEIGDKLKSPYTTFGDVRSTVESEGFANLRKQLKEFIENEAKKLDPGFNVKELNKEIQIANTLREAITKKEAGEQLKAIIRVGAPGFAAGGVAGATTEGGIVERLKNIVLFGVLGAIGGKVLQNKGVQSAVASRLNKLSRTELISVEEFIKSKGQTEISDKLLDVLADIRLDSLGLAISAGLITNEGDL